jgi:hypothetical protein
MDVNWNVVGNLAAVVSGVGGLIGAIIANVESRRARNIAERANWFTGAMESHSDMQVRIAARKEGLKAVWWDKSRYGESPSQAAIKHGEEINLETIYFNISPELRAQPDARRGFWRRLFGK